MTQEKMKRYIDDSYKIISGLIVAGSIAYCAFGEAKGISDYINKKTTFHVSSDIFLEKKEPTKLELKVMNKLGDLK